MNRKTLETIVLVIGLAIIATALYMMFAMETTPQTILVVFAAGFLVYILYAIMNANNLNREIRGLQKEVAAHKATIADQRQTIENQQETIEKLKTEKAELEEEITLQREKLEEKDGEMLRLRNELAQKRADI